MSRIRAFLDQISAEELIHRLDLAIEGTGLGIWDWDLCDDSVNFDRRWCEMLGLEHAHTRMHLETWRSRVHPDDLEGCYVDIKAHLEGRTERYENVHRMRHADGRWIWIHDRGRISAVDDAGKPVRFTGSHTDVTEREEAQRIRERHREQLQRLVARLPVSVALFDREGNVLARSPDWPAPEDAHGKFSALPSEGGPSLDDVQRALGGTRVSRDEEAVPGEGGPRFVRWSCEAWREPSGDLAGVQVVYADITEEVMWRRREAEDEDARVASLALFAGGVAHELNSPLQAILTEAEGLLLDRARGVVSDDVLGESIAIIRATAMRAGLITKALRALSRESRDDEPTAVPVETLWAHVRVLSASNASVAGVSLQFADVEPGLCVLAREGEVLQVALALVNNGVDACKDAIEPAESWVSLEAHASGDAVVLRCVDAGTGVPQRHGRDIFEPWFTTKTPGAGTGLGLAIARRLVERHGGVLRHVADAPHTTFEVRLPRARPAKERGR